MSASEAALVVDELVAGYGLRSVLHGVSFEVGAGEVVALLGANGAGKTTTLLATMGLLVPSSGRVTVAGRKATGRPVSKLARSGLTLVPEGRSLFTQLTVADNLRLASRRKGPSISWVVDYFPDLGALMGRKVGQLSGGEQQMLAIARGLLVAPSVLLVDELSLGLAPLVVRSLLAGLRSVTRDSGLGILIVEQHVRLALESADRAYVLQRGAVVLEGTASEISDMDTDLVNAYLSRAEGTEGA